MSPKNIINKVEEDMSQASYNDNLWFRFKTPDEFIYNGQSYSLSKEESKHLRENVKKYISTYLDAKNKE